jgi:hypothetical protein
MITFLRYLSQCGFFYFSSRMRQVHWVRIWKWLKVWRRSRDSNKVHDLGAWRISNSTCAPKHFPSKVPCSPQHPGRSIWTCSFLVSFLRFVLLEVKVFFVIIMSYFWYFGAYLPYFLLYISVSFCVQHNSASHIYLTLC